MIAIKGLDHVVLRVRDAARMVAFYRDVLGCAVERELPDIGLVQLRAGASLIDLLAVGEGAAKAPAKAGNMDHFCVQVSPFDADAVRQHLTRHGVAVGDVAERYGAEGTGPSIYIEDPEGNVVELKGPPRE